MASRTDGTNRPLLALSRVISLPPRALLRYLSDTLELGELARTGELAAIPNPPYLVKALRSLQSILEECGDPCDRLLTVIAAPGTNAGTDAETVRRGTTAFIECLARRAGKEIDELSSRADFPARARSGADRTGFTPAVLPVVLYLPHIRSPYNFGGIVRSAAAFGVAGVVYGADCPDREHPRAQRAAMGAFDLLPVERGGWKQTVALLEQRNPEAQQPPVAIAVETGGRSIHDVRFPGRTVLILGHEELGIAREDLEWAAESGGIVTIPHRGTKASLNVGVAAGIVLSWAAAQYTTG